MSTSRHRPKDRKRQIVLAARQLFVDHGSPNVTMAAVAERVEITAGALYRHFENKNALLEEVMRESCSFLDAPPVDASLEQMIDATIAGAANEYPRIADLWTREMRYLAPEVRRGYRARLGRWVHSFSPAIERLRPECDRESIDFVAWGLLSVFACLVTDSISAPANGRRTAVRAATLALASAPLAQAADTIVARRRRGGRTPSSRRERLLLAATEQFSSRGYQETSMASIGAAADVTGPNIYGYYSGKADLLRAVFERTAHLTWAVLDYSLSRSGSAEEALGAVVSDFVALVGYRGHFQFTGADHIADATRDEQREFVNEWMELVLEVVPNIDRHQARLRTLIALRVIADLSRMPPRSQTSSLFAPNLSAVVLSILRGPAREADPSID